MQAKAIISKYLKEPTIQKYGLAISCLCSIISILLFLYLENTELPAIQNLQEAKNPAEINVSIYSGDEENTIIISLDSLTFNPQQIEKDSIEGNPEEFCIDELIVNYLSSEIKETSFPLSGYCYRQAVIPSNERGKDQPLEKRYLLAARPIPLSETLLGEFRIERSLFFFPLDKRTSSIEIFLRLDINGKSGERVSIVPTINLELNHLSRWRYKTAQINDNNAFCVPSKVDSLLASPTQIEQASCIKLLQTRNKSQIGLTSLILFSLFSLIVLLVTVDERGAFLEVAVGIIFGLWGTREILIPNYITVSILINLIIFTLYFFLGFIVILRMCFWLSTPNTTHTHIQASCKLLNDNDRRDYSLSQTEETSNNHKRNNIVNQFAIFSVISAGIAALITFFYFIRKNLR